VVGNDARARGQKVLRGGDIDVRHVSGSGVVEEHEVDDGNTEVLLEVGNDVSGEAFEDSDDLGEASVLDDGLGSDDDDGSDSMV